MRPTIRLAAFALCVTALPSRAAVLPDDRADVLYHRYEGGGVTVDGPSLLVRKNLAEKYSVAANYYVDLVSSASIDVLSQASPYKETRQQGSLGLDMLNGKTQYSLSVLGSEENDYSSTTASFDVSQDLFGDLTTVSFGYSQGWDDVRKRGDPSFSEPVDRRSYRLGVSQVVTPSLIMGFALETITDEGYLQNPYRSMRYRDDDVPAGYAWAPEVYPSTRTSNAASLNARYFLWYRAALHGEYRYFTDTWGVDANTVRVGYVQPVGAQWTLEAGYRWYDQSRADFYSDLFPSANAQNFMGRDKELSTFQSHMYSVGASYELPSFGWKFLQRSTINLFFDYTNYDYADFRDVLKGGAPGAEPLYQFDAAVYRLFFSGWF
jgi:hypothetical protein